MRLDLYIVKKLRWKEERMKENFKRSISICSYRCWELWKRGKKCFRNAFECFFIYQNTAEKNLNFTMIMQVIMQLRRNILLALCFGGISKWIMMHCPWKVKAFRWVIKANVFVQTQSQLGNNCPRVLLQLRFFFYKACSSAEQLRDLDCALITCWRCALPAALCLIHVWLIRKSNDVPRHTTKHSRWLSTPYVVLSILLVWASF